ncbi:uncharacterized protein LOC141647669 [Silene latifolia]|uniref:uncharacterized protein LOC141647669 n=1 Tax=Silene latifolia TaxID=37657 RepID=UPI003D776EBC
MRVQKKRNRVEMGIARRHLLVGLGLVMVLGIAVYSRLWVIDYKISNVDSELLRMQFDLAHREAVDESAEWRLRFDQEREKSAKYIKELTEAKELLNKGTPSFEERVRKLQKENIELLQRLDVLKRELETVKLKCTTV